MRLHPPALPLLLAGLLLAGLPGAAHAGAFIFARVLKRLVDG